MILLKHGFYGMNNFCVILKNINHDEQKETRQNQTKYHQCPR